MSWYNLEKTVRRISEGAMKSSLSILRRIAITAVVLVTMIIATGISYAADEVRPDNGIPVVYITIDESQGTIAAMNEDEEHNTRCQGTISIDVPSGFHYTDMAVIDCSSLAERPMEIKGRGNTTWGESKKPYKVKLAKKADVLGLGTNKHWVLVANYFDRTLVRDRITAWLGDEIGLEFTPRGVPVDLVMKNTDGTYNKYLGSYYLSEQVRVGENRIEIEELTASDVAESIITGGYLVQNGSQTDESSPSYFTTQRDEVWANHTPNFDTGDDGYVNKPQQKYIRDYMQKVEDAIYSTDFEGKNRTSYRDLMDLESAAKYWLVMEACLNGDAYGTGSTYLYKKRGDKLYWGPLWDFDMAWPYNQDYKGFDIRHNWIRGMLYDTGRDGFVREVKKQWPDVREALLALARDGGMIDRYYEETKRSQIEDLKANPIPEASEDNNPREFDPQTDKELLKAWIIRRVNWMDSHMSDLDKIMHRITVKIPGQKPYYTFVQDGFDPTGTLSIPWIDGYVFAGWEDENGNLIEGSGGCRKDMTVIARYISEDKASRVSNIFLREKDAYIEFRGEGSTLYTVAHTLVPEDALIKDVAWITSDDSIASPDDEGIVDVHKPGTVVITAALNNGISRSITLHIVEGHLPAPDSIRTEKDVYRMHPGGYDQVIIRRSPERTLIGTYDYQSSDPGVVTVNENGMLTAIAPGRAYITIITETPFTNADGSLEIRTLETKCEVIVAEPSAVTYRVSEGDGQIWRKGSSEDAVFVYKRSADDDETFSHFEGIKVDGNDVSPSYYTSGRGSVIIRLKPGYLETLSIGKHTFTALFDDERASDAHFEVVSPDGEGSGNGGRDNTDRTGSVRTGDQSRLGLWAGILAAVIAGIIIATVLLKKKK